ncbi:MAG: hypothetical protein J6J24_04565 [Clostridia bacterium]|nr:hypothetical protein [Clostridia bacterium]
MTLEERTYTEVFDKKPKLQHDIADISAVNSIFFLLSVNGCYDKEHDYDWKIYNDDITFGPMSLGLWSDMNENLRNQRTFDGQFSKDAKTVLHSMKTILSDIPKQTDPRKVLIGMAGYKYISQTHRLPASAVEANFNATMPELSGMFNFCKTKNHELESKIKVLNTQRDKTL